MTEAEILDKVIEKALKNGWLPKEYLPAFPLQANHSNERLLRHMYKMWLFDHDFAKAFFGEAKPIDKTKTGREYGTRYCLHCNYPTNIMPPYKLGCNHAHFPEACDICRAKTVNWKDCLQEMAIEKNRVKYLEKFI